jgi:uncharacterized membrane protein YuzA (DUF378 family)
MMNIINKIALILIIVGALNWGAVGLFSFDLVAWLFGGATSILARIVYITIALAGLWSVSMLFDTDEETTKSHSHA